MAKSKTTCGNSNTTGPGKLSHPGALQRSMGMANQCMTVHLARSCASTRMGHMLWRRYLEAENHASHLGQTTLKTQNPRARFGKGDEIAVAYGLWNVELKEARSTHSSRDLGPPNVVPCSTRCETGKGMTKLIAHGIAGETVRGAKAGSLK